MPTPVNCPGTLDPGLLPEAQVRPPTIKKASQQDGQAALKHCTRLEWICAPLDHDLCERHGLVQKEHRMHKPASRYDEYI